MERKKWIIDQELLKDMGINPEEGVKHLENKKANTIEPVHVIAHQILKQQPMVASNS